MKSPNYKRSKVQLAFSCHQMKFQVLGLAYIQLSYWLKGSHGNHQATQGLAKTSCSLTN